LNYEVGTIENKLKILKMALGPHLTAHLSTALTRSPCEPCRHRTTPARHAGHMRHHLVPFAASRQKQLLFCLAAPLPRHFPHLTFERPPRRTTPAIAAAAVPSVVAVALKRLAHLLSMLHREPCYRVKQILQSAAPGRLLPLSRAPHHRQPRSAPCCHRHEIRANSPPPTSPTNGFLSHTSTPSPEFSLRRLTVIVVLLATSPTALAVGQPELAGPPLLARHGCSSPALLGLNAWFGQPTSIGPGRCQ
jgi:hypothetical protein